MFSDYILNGEGHGAVGQRLAGCHYDAGRLRPFLDSKGRTCMSVNTGERDEKGGPVLKNRLLSEMVMNGEAQPVANATTLRKDEWLMLDKAVVKAARYRLRAWADLAAANSFSGFDGMSKMMLEHETMSDPGEAVVDFDALTPGRTDAPQYQLEGLPLPITHADFYFSARRLAVSRNTGTPLDTTMAEACGRRVAEMIEQTTIGTIQGPQYGIATSYGQTPKVYGYTNHPQRTTYTSLNTPTGANGTTILTDFLACIDALYDAKMYGPYMVYHSTDYSQYLDNLFSTTEPSAGTLRSRLLQIPDIVDIRRLDYLTSGYQLVFVQMTPDVARAVIGMDITTVQWPTVGGMQLNFKVMAIMVPQIRADYDGNCGVLHATTS